MNYRKFSKTIGIGVMIFSFVITGVSGAYTSTAYAAESADTKDDTGTVSNNIVGGLVALGLIAAISSKHGQTSNSTPPSGNSVTGQSTTTTASTTSSGTTSTTTTPSASSSASTSATTNGQTSTASSGSGSMTADEQRAFNLLNADRAKNGLPALKWNSALTKLAENYGQDMINRNYFSHTNPEGQSPFDRMRAAGISYSYAGENLAINTSVDTAETAFMNSPGHRANILNSQYTQVGLGVKYDSRGEAYVVQEFIRP